MKFKKLLAGALSAAMVFGTMVMPAFAETLNTELGNPELIGAWKDIDGEGSGIDGMSVTLNNIPVVKDHFTMEMYHNEVLLSVTSATAKWLDDTTDRNNGTGTSVKIVYAGAENDDDPSWETTLKNAWSASRIPNKFVLSIDDYEPKTLTFDPNAGVLKSDWTDLDLTPGSKELAALIDAAQNGTLDLGNKTFVLDEAITIDENITIKNAIFDISGTEGSKFVVDGNATFENIKFTGSHFNCGLGIINNYYTNANHKDACVTIDNCSFDLEFNGYDLWGNGSI